MAPPAAAAPAAAVPAAAAPARLEATPPHMRVPPPPSARDQPPVEINAAVSGAAAVAEPVRVISSAAARRPRLRRSVAAAPAHFEPADIPEDAEGRVIFVEAEQDVPRWAQPALAPDHGGSSVAAVVPGASASGDAAPAPPRAEAVLRAWMAVGAVAVLIVVVFVVGVMATR